jgi:hypothetical protein
MKSRSSNGASAGLIKRIKETATQRGVELTGYDLFFRCLGKMRKFFGGDCGHPGHGDA